MKFFQNQDAKFGLCNAVRLVENLMEYYRFSMILSPETRAALGISQDQVLGPTTELSAIGVERDTVGAYLHQRFPLVIGIDDQGENPERRGILASGVYASDIAPFTQLDGTRVVDAGRAGTVLRLQAVMQRLAMDSFPHA